MAEAFLFGATIMSRVGTDFAVRTLTTTTSSICSLLSHLTSYDTVGIDDIKNELFKIDLENKVMVIEELIREYEKKEVRPSIKRAILGVNEILSKIHDELTIIKEAVETHQKKYFSSWRSFDCKYNIKILQKHKAILDERYNLLIDLLKIPK